MPLGGALSPVPIWNAWDGISRCILCRMGRRGAGHTPSSAQCLTQGFGRAVIVTPPGSSGSWMILGKAQEGQKPSTHRNGVSRDCLELFWTQSGGFLLPAHTMLVIPQGSPEAGAAPSQVPWQRPGVTL